MSLKYILVCSAVILGSYGAQLPSYITACSRTLPTDKLSACILEQAKNAQQYFVKGIPEFGLEPLDPLTVSDVSAKAGTFTIRSTNVNVKGLKKMEITDFGWDLEKNIGYMKLFGNLTFLSDYQTDGRILVIPITGSGKLTVKLYDSEIIIKYKIKIVKDDDGVEHLQTYDLRPTQTYKLVKFHMSNILGGATIGDTVNQILNENWRELMKEVGPPYTKAISDKVHELINKLYSAIPYDQLITP